MKPFLGVLSACMLTAFPNSASTAQSAPTTACSPCRSGVTVVGGVSTYDLSGTGNAALLGVHLDRIMQRWLVADASVRVMKPAEQFGRRAVYAIPEVQLQIQTTKRAVRPYFGAGGGWFIGSQGGGSRGTLSGALGLRYLAEAMPVGARAELRLRGIGRSFGGAAAEWTLGGTYRF